MYLAVELAAAASGGCDWYDGVCQVGELVGAITEAAGNAALQGVADAFLFGWAQLEMYFLASWIAMPLLVDLTAADGTAMWLQQILGSLTFAFAVLGGLITAGWTFLRLRTDKVKVLGGRLAVLLVVSTSGALIIAAADLAVRALSLGILGMVGISPEAAMAAAVLNGTAMAVSPGITLIIGIVAIIGVLIQWVIMIMRGPLVVLFVGLWPFAASAATLGVQKAESAFDQITAWLIAFVIYPFPAALVYAAAFRLKGGADGLGGIMYGLVLEVLAVLLMPALFRIIAPHTKAVGEKFGGKVAADAAVSAAETAVTVGAAVVTAGAAAGAFAAKVGAAGAKAGAAAASSATETAAAQGASVPAHTNGGDPSGVAGAGAGAQENAGAETVSSERAEPTGAVPDPTSDPVGATTTGSAAPDADTARPVDASGKTSPRRQESPARPGGETAEATSRQGMRVHAAAQAAQAASHGAGKAAREAMNDMDDIIGGKQ